MKGNPELIDTLNDLLASELAAINQYMPCQPSHLSASHRAKPPETSIPKR